MTHKYIYELFIENQSQDIIEVFNYYDGRYGNIFYNGEFFEDFYKEGFDTILGNYSFVKELEDRGVDIQNVVVLVYNLEELKDYENDMTAIDFYSGTDYSYQELLEAFNTDLEPLKKAIEEHNKNNKYYKFLGKSKLTNYI